MDDFKRFGPAHILIGIMIPSVTDSSESLIGYRFPSSSQRTRVSDDFGILLNSRRYRNGSDLTGALKDFHSPSLVSFLLVKGVENHLVFIILLATFDLQHKVGLEIVAYDSVSCDAPELIVFAWFR